MADAPDVNALRETSIKPSWWGRAMRSMAQWIPSSTTRTVLLALAIGMVIAVGFWMIL